MGQGDKKIFLSEYKMIFRIGLLFLVAFFASCNNENRLQTEIVESLEDFRKMLPEKMFDNFPEAVIDENKHIIIIYPESMKHNQSYCGVFIIHNLSDSAFNFEYEKIISNNFFIGRIAKEQGVIINVIEGENDYADFSDSLLSVNKYVVPNYSEKYSPLSKDSLSAQLETVIINSESGKYLPEEYYAANNSLPKEYKHGYSKGIYFDKIKYKMIYWLIIW